jgi:signal peptidase
MRKVFKYLGVGFIITAMVAVVIAFLAPHFGWRIDVVLSGSMEPQLKVGGLAISKPVNVADIKVDDTITFYSPQTEEVTSHRVIAINTKPSLYFKTKGDANEDADPFNVPAQNVVGRVCFHIPYLGYVIQFVKTPLGFVLAFCVPGFIIIVMEMKNIWRALSKDKMKSSKGSDSL